jgi:hypothetical protein
LKFINSWAGETSYDGTVYETFGSNIEYTVENLTNPDGDYEAGNEIKVTVTLNHPNYDVAALHNAVLYDGSLLTFKSAELVGDGEVYTSTGTADFTASDYGVTAMTTPSIAKVVALYDEAKPAQEGVRDEVMVLYFTVKGAASGSQKTEITSVPLAANVDSNGGNYVEVTTSNGDSEYVHRTGAKFTVGVKVSSSVSVSGSISAYNSNIETKLTLSNSDNTYTTTIEATAGSGKFTANYSFSDVEDGIYTLVIEKAGSLTYTINNIPVGDNDLELGSVAIIAGDVNGDGSVNVDDIAEILDSSVFLTEVDPSNPLDVNGDGVINTSDTTFILSSESFVKSNVVVNYGE